MRVFRTALLAACTWLALGSFAAAEVQLAIHDGRVTIVAKDATIRQILTEWARIGRTKIVNVERIPGGPLTLELKDIPEIDALDILLRTLSGYMAAPRAVLAADASEFETIIVMPTTAPPPSRSAASIAPAPFTPPSAFPNINDDEGPVPGAPGQPTRGPVFTTFPPQVGPGQQQQQRPNLPAIRPGILPVPTDMQSPNVPPPATPNVPQQGPSPSAPFGAVTTPGMIAQPAQQPGQIRVVRPNEN